MNTRPPASQSLVSTEWLAAHLDAPDIVVVDGSYYLPTQKRDGREEYLAAHIPGAVFFDVNAIADTTTDLPHMLPRPEAFSSAMRQLGIGDGVTIVVYDGLGLFSAARVWWTFRIFGVRDVYVLDGGFPKWKAEGRPIEFGEIKRTPRHFTSRFDPTAVADMAEVKQTLADKSAQVVDARSAERFAGTAPEPRPGLPSGHMPGAFNLPYSEIVRGRPPGRTRSHRGRVQESRRRSRQADRDQLRLRRDRRHPVARRSTPSASRRRASMTAPGPNGPRSPTPPSSRNRNPDGGTLLSRRALVTGAAQRHRTGHRQTASRAMAGRSPHSICRRAGWRAHLRNPPHVLLIEGDVANAAAVDARLPKPLEDASAGSTVLCPMPAS